MKKSTKYSVALISTTLLGSNPIVGNTQLTDTGDQKVVTKDSFLSKFPADLLETALQRTHFKSTRASGGDNGSSGNPGTTKPPVIDNPTEGTPPDLSTSGGPPSSDPGNIPPSDTTTPIINQLTFVGLDPQNKVGHHINAGVNIVAPTERYGRFDLWVAITTPSIPGFIFFTGTAQNPVFSLEPQPFLRSLDTTLSTYAILEFEVPAGIGGEYTFYALLVEEGKNPLEAAREYDRSNLAVQTIKLDNE